MSKAARPRRVVLALISLVFGATATLACLHDFDTFVGPAPGPEVPDADASLVPFTHDDGASRTKESGADGTEPCLFAPQHCLDDRGACRTQCGQIAAACLAQCSNPAEAGAPDAGDGGDAGDAAPPDCNQKCRDAFNACNGNCDFSCLGCGGSCTAGCLP